MISGPRASIEAGGLRWTVRPPATAEAALEGDIYHVAQTQEHLQNGTPRERDIEAMIRWCASHVVAVDGEDGPEWSELSGDEKTSWVDRCLDIGELREMRETILEVGSLPDHFLEQVQELYRVSIGGGCECAVCDGPLEATQSNVQEYCLYGRINDDVERMVSAVAPFGEDAPLDAPWWVYQILRARHYGSAQAFEEKRQEREQRERTRSKLSERGLL